MHHYSGCFCNSQEIFGCTYHHIYACRLFLNLTTHIHHTRHERQEVNPVHHQCLFCDRTLMVTFDRDHSVCYSLTSPFHRRPLHQFLCPHLWLIHFLPSSISDVLPSELSAMPTSVSVQLCRSGNQTQHCVHFRNGMFWSQALLLFRCWLLAPLTTKPAT